jgi:hypothetical protein
MLRTTVPNLALALAIEIDLLFNGTDLKDWGYLKLSIRSIISDNKSFYRVKSLSDR